MFKKSFFIFSIFLATFSNAECLIDYSVLYAVASCERHIKRDVGYPYLISFNNKSDVNKAKKNLTLNWMDNRTVDCKSRDNCKKKLKTLNDLNINNLDLGGYQICQRSFNYKDYDEYFTLKKSYQNACGIIYSHYKETKKWSWQTIARYHSKTPKLNRSYSECLKRKYQQYTLKD